MGIDRAVDPPSAAGSATRALRVALILAGLASLVVAAGFFERAPWATDLWPWEESRLSYIFIASILVAIALPVLWIGTTGELAAIRAGALDLAVMYAGMFAYVLTLVGDDGEPDLAIYAVVFGLATVAMLATFAWSRRLQWNDPREMAAPVRLSFAVFAALLLGFGIALIARAEVFPWDLGGQTSVMFGVIYLGAAVYFIFGAAEPKWANAQGQLIGFLAYDLVLIGPFIDHFGSVSGGALTSLAIYTAFVVYSAGLAVYYLFLRPLT